jgi:putative transposase
VEDVKSDNAIRKATNSGRPFGSETFVDVLEFRLNQSLKPGKPGRPKKETGECP